MNRMNFQSSEVQLSRFINCYSEANATLKQQKRWNHNHVRLGRVQPTESQVERSIKIFKYGVGKGKTYWQRILKMFHREKQNYGFMELSMTLTQLSKIPSYRKDHQGLSEILEIIATHIEESSESSESVIIDTTCYANICNAIAKLQDHNSDATQRIFNHLSSASFAKALFEDGNPQDISNVFWSLAQLKRPDLMKPLLQQMDERCRNSLFQDKTQALGIIVWACASLGQSSPELFALVEQHSLWLVAHGQPPDIARIAWACATMGHAAPLLFDAIEQRSDWIVSNGNPHMIATIAWACATADQASPLLVAAIIRHWDFLKAKGTKHHVDDLVGAFKKLSVISNSATSEKARTTGML